VAKKNRREQHHLRQAPARKRSYQMGGSAPREIYKPGFPMNLIGNIKVFSVVGIVVAGIMVVTMIWFRGNNATRAVDTPTITPTASASPTADTSATATASATPAKSFTKAEQVIDATKNTYTATIKTDKGDIVIKLNADVAPNTVNSFVFLAKQGYFDGITFHRVSKGFVIQSGDPTGKGTGGPGYSTPDEPNQLSNKRGTLSMAKTSGAKEFGSQFFINLRDNPSLDYTSPGDKFYPFGEVTSGMDVVDAIGAVQTDVSERPLQPVNIISVTVAETPK
jgi:cyclophilin family peptidyl-prolyl cis-trans isomerase